jgi:hypothetical protein
MQFTSTLNDIC